MFAAIIIIGLSLLTVAATVLVCECVAASRSIDRARKTLKGK